MSAPGIEIVEWKSMRRNSLLGFATVRLRMGLIIADITIHSSNGKRWASLPSRPMVDRDGNAMRDRATGKIRYSPILNWSDRDTADRFSAAVITALEAAHPQDLKE